MFKDGELWIVDIKYACFGIIVDHLVVETPPIAKWMLGKDINTIEKWVKTKNGTLLNRKI